MKDPFSDEIDGAEMNEHSISSPPQPALEPPSTESEDSAEDFALFVDDAKGPHLNSGTKFDVDKLRQSAKEILASRKWKSPMERHDFVMDICRVFGWPASDLNDKRDAGEREEASLVDMAADRAEALLKPKAVSAVMEQTDGDEITEDRDI